MKGLKIAALAVLFDALFPLAAFMMPKPFIALTPLFQRAEVSQAALSACQWACLVAAAVIGAAGDQSAQIRVEGNLASPVIQQENLPGLKKAWWSIFPEQEPTPAEAAPEERAKPVRDAIKKLVGGSDKDK